MVDLRNQLLSSVAPITSEDVTNVDEYIIRAWEPDPVRYFDLAQVDYAAVENRIMVHYLHKLSDLNKKYSPNDILVLDLETTSSDYQKRMSMYAYA